MSNVLLVSYDNGSYIPFFPQNIFYLAGALKEAGHTVGLWSQDIHHGKEEELTRILDNNPFDVVGLGFCAGYWQYNKAKKISEAINKSKNRKNINYVLGGHGPAGDPKFFLSEMEADTVIIGDGEKAICDVAGNNTKGIIQGEPCNEDKAPLEVYRELFHVGIYRLIRWPLADNTDFCFPILSSRGCKWKCSFCFRMRKGFHERAVPAIIEEITYLHDNHQINYFQFSDELLMSSEKRTAEICEAILALPFKIKWDCNGRLNFATLPLLKIMQKSGAQYVNYGIESLNQGILNQMEKGLTVSLICKGVEATLEAGLSPGLNLLWGFPENTETDLQENVNFLLKYDPCEELRTIRPVTPYPGTPLFQEARILNLINDAEDFYKNKHKNSDLFTVNFMDMPTKDAHRMLWLANDTLARNYMSKKKRRLNDTMEKLYLKNDYSFRGFRDI